MGNPYVKVDDDEWAVAVPWVKTTTGGWSRVRQMYRKTAPTVWTPFWTADLTAPAAPTLTVTIEAARLKITVKAPTVADMYRVRVKVGKAVAATTTTIPPYANTTTDSAYISTPDAGDATWSDWLIASGATRTKYYPLTGSLSSGSTYKVSAWSEDKSHNYSAPTTKQIKYTTTSPTTPTSKTVTIAHADSRTWYQTTCKWGDRKEIRVGNPENRSGFLFYSTRLSSQLKGAKSISNITLKLQRMPDIDYDKAVKFKIFAHSMLSYSNVNPYETKKYRYTYDHWYTMNRGQVSSISLPSSFFAKFITGEFVGLGIISQGGSGVNATDPYCGSFYGFGTSSGTITATFTK